MTHPGAENCVVCFQSAKNVVLLRCKHLCLCELCSGIITQTKPRAQQGCPLCRKAIKKVLTIFV